MSFDDQISRVSKFAVDRDWEQFHSVRNLILALVGEVGELAEIVQWVSDEKINDFFSACSTAFLVATNFTSAGTSQSTQTVKSKRVVN